MYQWTDIFSQTAAKKADQNVEIKNVITVREYLDDTANVIFHLERSNLSELGIVWLSVSSLLKPLMRASVRSRIVERGNRIYMEGTPPADSIVEVCDVLRRAKAIPLRNVVMHQSDAKKIFDDWRLTT